MRWHVRAGHLQYLRSLCADAEDCEEGGDGHASSSEGFPSKLSLKYHALPCELGIRYPTLQAILSGKHNIQTTLVRRNAISYTISVMISYTLRDRHTASRPRPAARGAPPAIIIREDSASTFTFSSPRSTGQKWPQRRSLATSRWWVPTATQTKGRQASGSTTLTEWYIPSCAGCPRNWPNGLATITEQLSAFRCGTTLPRGRSASSTPS